VHFYYLTRSIGPRHITQNLPQNWSICRDIAIFYFLRWSLLPSWIFKIAKFYGWQGQRPSPSKRTIRPNFAKIGQLHCFEDIATFLVYFKMAAVCSLGSVWGTFELLKKSTRRSISLSPNPPWRDFHQILHSCIIITCDKFFGDWLRDVDSVGGRNGGSHRTSSHWLLTLCWRDCTASHNCFLATNLVQGAIWIEENCGRLQETDNGEMQDYYIWDYYRILHIPKKVFQSVLLIQ